MSPSGRVPVEKLRVQRVTHPGADYVKLGGTIDKSFSVEKLGPINRPTALDLKEIERITSQGVERWCDMIRLIPKSTPLFLINVPPSFATQLEYVPNFAGHAEIVTLIAVTKCTGCERTVPSLYDLMCWTAGSQQMDKCSQCGAVMVAVDCDLQQLAKIRARALPSEVAELLAKIGVYKKKPGQAQTPFDVQKLIEGHTTLMRLSGTFDDKFRWQRMLDGLEGTLLLDAQNLEVGPAQQGKFVELLEQMTKAASPVVLVNAPTSALDALGGARASLTKLVLHSVLAPCYCETCDEIRQIAVGRDTLLSNTPEGTCPRCGRIAPLIAGTIAMDGLRPLLRPTPPELLPIVARMEQFFSSAEVEAKLTGQTASTTPDAPAAAPPGRIGPYRIVRTIAAGGMATVFLAVRDDFSKPMALKLLRREILQHARISLTMFLREARLSARLNHPNIIQVFDVNESEGNLYIVMEYLEGHALWRILGQYAKPFPPRIALRIISQVLSALQHAHTARDTDGQPLSIVHRDVSPSNILIGVDGNVKLIDFGIALAGSTPDVMAGNPAWMSPEQFAGGALDGRSDLYSVATVLHELLIGKQLFTGANIGEIGFQVITSIITTPAGIPASLAQVMRRAHQRGVDERYQTAAEFAEALRSIAPDVGGEASEHEVRAFVADVLAGRPPKAAEFALCETPLSEPDQRLPKRPSRNRTAAPAVVAATTSADGLADTPDAGPKLTPPPQASPPPPRAEFDAPLSNRRAAAALLPLVDPPPNRGPTLVIAVVVTIALGLIGALSLWML